MFMDTEKEVESGTSPTKIMAKSYGQFILPAAILIAALIVAGALIFTRQGGQKGAAQLGGAGNNRLGQQVGGKVDVAIGHLPPLGNPNAKVKIVEFGDFRCPFCDRFFKEVEPQLKEYLDAGKAVFYFRHYQFLGPASVVAGNAAECANEQNKFWAFHDYLYQNQPPESDTSLYTTANLTKIAGKLGLNTAQFSSCLASQKYSQKVEEDLTAGQQAGTTGTPTVFINGQKIVGAQPYANFKAIIDDALAKK